MLENITSIDDINMALDKEALDLVEWASALNDDTFFKSVDGKWSTGEQIEHLKKSSSPLVLALRLPKFVLSLVVGKPNRASRSFDDVQLKYKIKLDAIVEMPTTRFYPNLQKDKSKKQILDNYLSTTEKLNKAINRWQDEDLDKYILPHPLLGKVTVREMLYFTIFHTRHHFNSVKSLYSLEN